MGIRNLLFVVSFLGFVACSQKSQVVELEKISADRVQNLQMSLLTGLEVSNQPAGDCSGFIKLLPENYFHGYVSVPENWNEPEGKKIRVFYYGQILEGKDPVVFYNGGPTSDSHGSYQILSQQSQYSQLSFIFVDQRGTGCSDPFPMEFGEDTLYRLVNYGSRGIVLDSEAVRRKVLGENGSWKIFGQSYGGRIVHRYAEVDLSHVSGAYAHGYSVMSDSDEWMVMRLLSQKRVLADYIKKYPEDAGKLRSLQDAIPEARCFTNGEIEVCGPRVVDGFTIFLGFQSSWGYMHSLLRRLVTDEGINENLLNQFIQDYAIGVFANNYVAAAVIGMADMSSGKPIFDFCTEPIRRLIARGEDPSSWIINECRLLAGFVNKKWDPLLKKMAEDDSILDETTLPGFADALKKHPQVPFYLYAGKMDVFVPYETFVEEVDFMKDLIRYTLFEKSGHEGFYSEPQVWNDLLRN
ncbi:MAG: hypothetical protein AB7O96_05275 [Pseudobdellovibrionaceae bacterium]